MGSGRQPGSTRGKRFKPEAFYGTPYHRKIVMVVDLPTEADVAELMMIAVRTVDTEPKFTPLIDPALFGAAIEKSSAAPFVSR